MNTTEIPEKTKEPIFKSITAKELEPLPTDMPVSRDETGAPIRKSHSYYKGAFDTKNNRFAYKEEFVKPKSVVKKSPISGYGVFADEDIKAGDLIEECLAILTDTTFPQNKDWVLGRYLFTWNAPSDVTTKNGSTMAMLTGNALLYNHSEIPNSYYVQDSYLKMFRMYALSDIKKGEEIVWYYGAGYAKTLRDERKITSDTNVPDGFRVDPKTGNIVPVLPKKGGCGCGKKTTDPKNPTPKQLEGPKGVQSPEVKIPPESTPEKLLFRSMVVPEKIINDDKVQNSQV